MNLLQNPSLEFLADPQTDPRLLPLWMRPGEASEEAACYRAALRLAMDHVLTPQQSQVIHMRYWLNMPVVEIGRELGVTGPTVSKRITAALNALRFQVGFCVEVWKAMRQREE